jgi:signal transduction histidine kinase
LPDTNIRNELDDIASTSRKLVDNIGEIIWSLHPQHDSLEILISHLREQLNKLTEYAAFTCHIDFPEQVPNLVLNNQLRRNILLVCKEIVHNSIKYSQGDHISIQAKLEKNRLEFVISDNGVGFDEHRIKKGNGLDNIRKRVNESGGQVNIESEKDLGTTFRFWFPISGYY